MDASTRNRVVVRFKDGKLLKGFTHDFTPIRDTFHLTIEAGNSEGSMEEINIDALKAIFFVKTLEGDRNYIEKKLFEQVDQSRLRGLKIRVEFEDGEVCRGISLGYNKNKKGFFMIPVDPDSNNDRIYVIADACKSVQVGEVAKV
jgi:hypothetical protein